jgi:aspartate aminotransferase-like enzyme
LKGSIFRIGNMGIVCEEYVKRTLESLENTLSELGYKH